MLLSATMADALDTQDKLSPLLEALCLYQQYMMDDDKVGLMKAYDEMPIGDEYGWNLSWMLPDGSAMQLLYRRKQDPRRLGGMYETIPIGIWNIIPVLDAFTYVDPTSKVDGFDPRSPLDLYMSHRDATGKVVQRSSSELADQLSDLIAFQSALAMMCQAALSGVDDYQSVFAQLASRFPNSDSVSELLDIATTQNSSTGSTVVDTIATVLEVVKGKWNFTSKGSGVLYDFHFDLPVTANFASTCWDVIGSALVGVVTALTTVIAPMIGLALSVVGSALSGIGRLFTNAMSASTEIRYNGNRLDDSFAIPYGCLIARVSDKSTVFHNNVLCTKKFRNLTIYEFDQIIDGTPYRRMAFMGAAFLGQRLIGWARSMCPGGWKDIRKVQVTGYDALMYEVTLPDGSSKRLTGDYIRGPETGGSPLYRFGLDRMPPDDEQYIRESSEAFAAHFSLLTACYVKTMIWAYVTTTLFRGYGFTMNETVRKKASFVSEWSIDPVMLWVNFMQWARSTTSNSISDFFKSQGHSFEMTASYWSLNSQWLVDDYKNNLIIRGVVPESLYSDVFTGTVGAGVHGDEITATSVYGINNYGIFTYNAPDLPRNAGVAPPLVSHTSVVKTLIGVGAATIAAAAIAATRMVVGARLKRSQTQRRAQLEEKRRAMAAASGTDGFPSAYKEYRNAQIKYSIITRLTGQAGFSTVGSLGAEYLTSTTGDGILNKLNNKLQFDEQPLLDNIKKFLVF